MDRRPSDLERQGWAELFASYDAVMGTSWLECCDQPGPLHADDCPTLEAWGTVEKEDGAYG